METKEVKIVGGTFFLCVWLFSIAIALDHASNQLERIADALERAYPKVEKVKP